MSFNIIQDLVDDALNVNGYKKTGIDIQSTRNKSFNISFSFNIKLKQDPYFLKIQIDYENDSVEFKLETCLPESYRRMESFDESELVDQEKKIIRNIIKSLEKQLLFTFRSMI